MRDAFAITIGIIFISVVLGVIYNLMKPYLIRLEVLQENGSTRKVLDDGGVFFSGNSGRSWKQAGVTQDKEKFLRSDVFDFEFSLQDPNIIYAATSAGLYTSQDGGEQWSPLFGGALERESLVWAFAVDPKSPWRMYGATNKENRGKIVKSNGGDFYEVYSTQNVGDKVGGIWIDPAETSRLYAATAEGLFLVSEDFGESWKVRREFQTAVRGLSITQGDTRIMYAVGDTGKIFKTSDRGGSWRDISGAFSQYGANFKINDIVRDPRDENHLYLATSVGLFESKDAGATFSQVPLLTSAGALSVGAVSGDPKNFDTLYIGVGPQVHKSTDGGRNWQVKTLSTSRNIRALSIKPDDSSVIFAGAQHD